MGIEQKTYFKADKSKCMKCGKRINTCSGMVMQPGEDGYPEINAFGLGTVIMSYLMEVCFYNAVPLDQ